MVGNDQNAEFCGALGADVVFSYHKQNFVAEVQAHTAMRGVDVILDMVGGKSIAQNVTLLTLEGRLVQITFLEVVIHYVFPLADAAAARRMMEGSRHVGKILRVSSQLLAPSS